MNYKCITTVSLCSVFFFSTWCFSNEAQMKHPPKPKPEPEEIQLPAPFDQWDECDILSKVYSAYNCDTGIIGKKNEVQPAIDEAIGEINKVALWKTNGKKQLLVLIETRFARPYEVGSTGKGVDLALFDVINNQLSLASFTAGVVGYREFGYSKFDLAPYKINSQETAIGVRWSSGINGIGEEFLDLFRIGQKKFNRIFSYQMWFESDSNGSKSILQVIQNSSGMNDFLIITNMYLLDENGEKQNTGSKTTKEIWHWDDKTQAYVGIDKSRKVVEKRRVTK